MLQAFQQDGRGQYKKYKDYRDENSQVFIIVDVVLCCRMVIYDNYVPFNAANFLVKN